MNSVRAACTLSLCLGLLGLLCPSRSAAEATVERALDPHALRALEGPGGELQVGGTGADPRPQLASEAVDAAKAIPLAVVTAVRSGDVVWVGGRAEIPGVERTFLAEVGRDGVMTPLPAPGGREQARTFPTLLAAEGRVQGVVWQEGDQQEAHSIRAAAWQGNAWGEVEMVSPALGREQTGLTAALLADGSWLLVWAVADGDDDLWWSRRSAGAWSPPRRVHADNDVPDVLPRLAPWGDGALLAWTAFDGSDYRLRLAVLENSTWIEQPVAGGRGVEPARWLDLGASLGLLFSSVEPEAWNLVTVDVSGRVLGRLEAARLRLDEPRVVERGGRLELRWPQGSAAEAALEARLAPAQEPTE